MIKTTPDVTLISTVLIKSKPNLTMVEDKQNKKKKNTQRVGSSGKSLGLGAS